MKITDIVNDLFQTGTDGKSTIAGVLSVKCIENDNLVSGIFKISLHHC